MNSQQIEQFLQDNLLKVNKPIQYLGNELNVIKKDWQLAKTKLCFVYPDKYEIGMSNMALQIFYKLINVETDHLLERAFIPDTDMIDLLKAENIPLFAVESKTPLRGFDAVAISFSTELSYTNALLAIDLADIPLKSADRIGDENLPILFAGGGAVINPLPMSMFIDFFVIGDGEIVIEQICDVLHKCKNDLSLTKKETLEKISKFEHVYVPIFHDKETIIEKATFKEVNDPKYIVKKPLVPLLKVVHNRFSVELMRGCPRICRFCQASYINKPVRLRKKDVLLDQARNVMATTGYEEISLSSLSSSDYPKVLDLLNDLDAECVKQQVKLSLPSLRVDSMSADVSEMTNKIRQSGVTLAPEAGSQFIRDVILKNISEEEILNTVRTASMNSKKGIKLYFMIGLPREEQEDLQAIVDLAFKIIRHIKPARNKIVINFSNFIPKAFTPFQWAKQDDRALIDEKLKFFKKELRHKQMEMRWTDAELSVLEGILSRGDEKVGDLIYAAYKNGAIFDAWYDHFNFDNWAKAAKECSFDIDKYLCERQLEQSLPWGFIATGVKVDAMKKEYTAAYSVMRPPKSI